MADNIRQTRVSLRTDTLNNWTAHKDIILLEGEMAIVIDGDSQMLKIGDGIHTFEQLPYVTDNLVAKDIAAKSIAQGYHVSAIPTGLATGVYTEVSSSFGIAHGIQAQAISGDNYAFVYNGVALDGLNARYGSHGEGTFNINPTDGLSGFYIGENTAHDIVLSNNANVKNWIIDQLTAYFQKPETFSKDQVLSCVAGVLSSVNENFYTRAQVSSIIEGYEFDYRLWHPAIEAGQVLLKNGVNNILEPAADISCIFPRTIVNSSQLGRQFFIQVTQPDPAVNLDFVGYDGEQLLFKATEDIGEMEAGQHYFMLFTELSSGCFAMWQRKLTWLSSEVEPEPTPGIQSYQLYDVEVNFIELDQDSRLVFPPKAYDISGDWLPRDFLIYVKQPLSGDVFDIELAGNAGETLVFKSPDNGSIGSMSLSGEYLYAISEIVEPVDLSSTFVIKQLTLHNVTDI